MKSVEIQLLKLKICKIITEITFIFSIALKLGRNSNKSDLKMRKFITVKDESRYMEVYEEPIMSIK